MSDVIGRCQHCNVAQYANPDADPALASMADLCWKCVRPWRANGVLKINGEVVNATEFAYDGCHKIYLINTSQDRELMADLGYGTGESQILPVSELPEVWEDTCPLRFISSADLERQYIEQCEDGTVTWGN